MIRSHCEQEEYREPADYRTIFATINLTQLLLALQVNFVITSAGLQHIVFEFVDMSDMLDWI